MVIFTIINIRYYGRHIQRSCSCSRFNDVSHSYFYFQFGDPSSFSIQKVRNLYGWRWKLERRMKSFPAAQNISKNLSGAPYAICSRKNVKDDEILVSKHVQIFNFPMCTS